MARTDGLALTERAVERQLAAMGCESYDLLVKTQPDEKVICDFRSHSSSDIMGKIMLLRSKNGYEACDILIHPHGPSGLILVDDVTVEAQQEMDVQGFRPALTTITSYGNFAPKYQAWVRVTLGPITEHVGTALARKLAQRFNADPGAANWRQFGRLAGYTNRKPKYLMPDGLRPFVKVVQDCGQVAPAGAALLAEVSAVVPATPQATLPASFCAPEGGARADLLTEYRSRWRRYLKSNTVDDHSAIDYRLLSDLARAHPDATAHDLAWTLLGGSPGLGTTRHQRDPRRWAITTALAVLERMRGEGRVQ